MASKTSPLKTAFACAVLFLLSASKYACGRYKSIINFGDSIADTGNLLYLESTSSNKKPPLCGFLPYGETFFHHPTGRFSDGRLIIDFIAQDMGLPFVPSFHGEGNVSRSFQEGVNFAVSGSTALEDSFFAK
ncbi:unnamed protein product [Fraxinus pennsylvanica]|uniref:GDSL esterase/lipase n=1 Tax=Fraxinus pennsylvanica TaxID=56036 RepID=A0AAD2EDE9_9LAMI|nr:unnamed protein product [Fraxinus pennsylvanica]